MVQIFVDYNHGSINDPQHAAYGYTIHAEAGNNLRCQAKLLKLLRTVINFLMILFQ